MSSNNISIFKVSGVVFVLLLLSACGGSGGGGGDGPTNRAPVATSAGVSV